ncbi:hypothetical protein L6452_17349 [Arctium lappa]|uniref:Uncharacterized protein n=1 Tax=Arctium lappa TaxID=4217 RepID=A0ACB9C374_ARCLA|nr:hypothetical protein L6452_17349 [Arctium lappa]
MSSTTKAWVVAGTVGLVEALKDQGFARWNYTIRVIHHHTKSNLPSFWQAKKLSTMAKNQSIEEKVKQSEESLRKVMYLRRRSNWIKIKRSSKVSNNEYDTIVNDSVGEGECTPEDTVVAKNNKKRCAISVETSINQQEVQKKNKRPKTTAVSDVMASNKQVNQKWLQLHRLLPSVTHALKRKNTVKDKSNKSPDKRKSSKSPVKNKSSNSTVRVTILETNDVVVVVESTRKTRSKTRATTVQKVSKKTKHGKGIDTGPAECSDTLSRSKAKNVKTKMVDDNSIKKKLAKKGGSDNEQKNEHGFEMLRRTKDSKQDQPTRVTDIDPTPNESVGLELVPGVPLETEPYWNSPTTIMAIDNSCIDYCKKRKIDKDAIPKFDLGISPERKSVSPLPISSIIPMTKAMFSLNSRVKAICDAPRLGKREDKPGEALRSPYVKRTVDIDTSETSSEKKICAWINVVVEPRPSILIIDNIQQELETPAKFEEIRSTGEKSKGQPMF